MIALFLHISRKGNCKVSWSARCFGETGEKIGLNVENGHFPQGLSRDFSRLSSNQNTLFYTFSDQIHPPVKSQKARNWKVKKLCFWTNFKQFPQFYPLPLPILGLNFIISPYPVIIEVTLAKSSFSKLMPIQSYQGKTLGGGGKVDLTLPPGIRSIMIRTLIYILSKVISDDLSFYPAKSPLIKEFKFSR